MLMHADAVAAVDDPAEARARRAELVNELRFEVQDARVLDAIGRVPRHLFAPRLSLRRAYVNDAEPIGCAQTISQPSVVAIMTEALALRGSERVLEIGTGSGYQAAVLSLLCAEVFTIEVFEELADEAAARLEKLGYRNVRVRAGDGHRGWAEAAPFDRIVITAAPEEVPQRLFDQLADGGILVAPVGSAFGIQSLLRWRKKGDALTSDELGAVTFVPMVHAE
jgi:protein-L-isoaspartate(D-aspartate) O-methyltransferase